MFYIPLFLMYGLLAAIISSILCSSVGTFIVLRGLSFMGAGVAHAALAGAALALLLNLTDSWSIFALALLFSLPLAFFVAYVGERGLRMDIAVGIMFALNMSLSVLFIGMLKEYTIEAWSLIFGDILGVNAEELILMVISMFIIEIVLLLFYKEFKFIVFDFEGAIASGIHARIVHYIMTFIVALAIVSVLKSVGALLVFALTVAPPFAAYELTHNIDNMLLLSLLLGVISSILGIILAFYINLPASAVIALTATTTAAISMVISPRRRKCCNVLAGRVRFFREKRV